MRQSWLVDVFSWEVLIRGKFKLKIDLRVKRRDRKNRAVERSK